MPSKNKLITQLQSAIQRFSQGRVLVVGDLVIDEMVYGHTHRLSREAPVLILRHDHTDIILGAAGNAAHNIAALNAKHTAVLGTCGDDYYASHLLEALRRDGIDPDRVIQDRQRPTSTKTRVSGIANQSVTQQIVRMDRDSKAPLSPEIEAKMMDVLTSQIEAFDALLLSDYGLGMMTPKIIETCQQLCLKHQKIMTVDTQQSMSAFQKATIQTPNQPEAEQNVGYEISSRDRLLKAGEDLLALTQAENILITLGSDGMALFENNGQLTEIPAFNRSEVFDVTGAGDTVIGTLTLALATGASLLEATLLGNLAASIVVKRFGAAVTSQQELCDALELLDETVIQKLESLVPQSEKNQKARIAT